MSEPGSVNEAVNVLSAVQEKVREASVEAYNVVEFLNRMHTELSGLGLPVEAIEQASETVKDWTTEADGLAESIGDLQNAVLALAERG